MNHNNSISPQDIERSNEILRNIGSYYYTKMVGQRQLGTSLLVAIMCNGHILIESVPGLAKTTAAKIMTEAVNGTFPEYNVPPIYCPVILLEHRL